MNFGTTGVAAPNAASSSTARYSRTACVAASGADHSPPGTLRCRLASALIMLSIDGKALAAHQSLGHAAPHGRLEYLAQQIAVAEAAVSVLREGRMVRH